MFIKNNRPSFHLWWKENLVKHRKVSKYYDTDCGLFGKAQQFDSLAALRGFCYLKIFFRISWVFLYSKECRKHQTVRDRYFQRSSSFASVYLFGSTFSKVLLTLAKLLSVINRNILIRIGFIIIFITWVPTGLKSDSYLPKNCFICFNESPSKLMKNVFHFILKALLVLKILLLSLIFIRVKKTAWINEI